MITRTRPGRQPTKQRLLAAGVRLFAEQGYRETTVGDIEAAAGLQPRRGALYRHFPSKEALLHAALEEHLRTVVEEAAVLDMLTTADPRGEAVALGRWLLAELDRERPIVRILEQDGERLPALRDAFRRALVDTAYVIAGDMTRRWLGQAAKQVDVESVSAVMLGALVNYRRSTWTFGDTPLGIDDERFLSTWADLCVSTADALRRSTGPSSRARR